MSLDHITLPPKLGILLLAAGNGLKVVKKDNSRGRLFQILLSGSRALNIFFFFFKHIQNQKVVKSNKLNMGFLKVFQIWFPVNFQHPRRQSLNRH